MNWMEVAKAMAELIPKMEKLGTRTSDEFLNTIKVFTKGVPEESLSRLNEVRIATPEKRYLDRLMPGYAEPVPFGEHTGFGGTVATVDRVNFEPPNRFDLTLVPTRSRGYERTLPSVVSHEMGHVSSLRAAEKVGGKEGFRELFDRYGAREGLADVWGDSTRYKVGVPPYHEPNQFDYEPAVLYLRQELKKGRPIWEATLDTLDNLFSGKIRGGMFDLK